MKRFLSWLTSLACIVSLSLCLGFYNVAPSYAETDASSNISFYTDSSVCPADPTWIFSPNPPSEIPGGGTNFCQFYQFSWQWFLYLMAPSKDDPSLRNFQVTADYPILRVKGDSCTSTETKPTFFIRMVKDPKDRGEFVLPERIGQAGGGATIYAQNDNVVFYSVAFGRDLCSAPTEGNLPSDTTEIKMAWKTITDAEKPNYLWISADVIPEQGKPIEETLGLVGYHLVRGTAEHPELIWTTFEHRSNAPNCLDPSTVPNGGWSFLSNSCSQCLSSPNSDCFNSCKFNRAQPATSLTTTTPSEICRVFPDGTAPGDNKGEENISVVDSLNRQLQGMLNWVYRFSPNDPMAVLRNYFNLGALWVSDITQPATSSNQRGSLQLANPTMETTFQGSLTLNGNSITRSTNGGFNCFACHQYTPNETATSGLSHIFDDIHGKSN